MTHSAQRIAFVFPGQGAQSVGMGADFLATGEPLAQQWFAAADSCVPNLTTLCCQGPAETLQQTQYTQPAILTVSLIALDLFRQRCPHIQPVVTAGHSLGEYGALYASGVLSQSDVLHLVTQRGKLMQQAPAGTMAVVLGAPRDALLPLLGQAVIANDNANDQVVLSGSVEAIEQACAAITQAKIAKRVLPLAVGGAFHSPLMQAASEQFASVCADMMFQSATVPVLSNVSAQCETQADVFRQNCATQIRQGVRWREINQAMATMGIDTVIEFGPGKVLTGLAKKAIAGVTCYNISDISSLEAACAEFSLTLNGVS